MRAFIKYLQNLFTTFKHTSTFSYFFNACHFFHLLQGFFHSTMTTVQLPCHIFFTSVLGTERKKNELVKQVLKLIARNYCSKKIMKRTDGFSVLMTSLCWFFCCWVWTATTTWTNLLYSVLVTWKAAYAKKKEPKSQIEMLDFF